MRKKIKGWAKACAKNGAKMKRIFGGNVAKKCRRNTKIGRQVYEQFAKNNTKMCEKSVNNCEQSVKMCEKI